MAYERLDKALAQLKTDRERKEASERQRMQADAEAGVRFLRIKSAVIEPIFNEVVARVTAEGFFGETVDEQANGFAQVSLNVNLSEDEGSTRQGSLQVRFNPDKYTCEFGRSTMAKASSTIQFIFDGRPYKLKEITEEMVRDKAEQFALDLITEKLCC
jgi:hypothetical protein